MIVGKQRIQETKQVQDIIRKEEARIERSHPSAMNLREQSTQFTHVGQEEFITGSPNTLIAEGNPDIASIMAEDKKEETRGKRTGSLSVQGENKQTRIIFSKKEATSGMLKDSPIKEKESESYEPISATTLKEEAIHSNEKPSIDEENKSNKNK